jgi:hypothetical protein
MTTKPREMTDVDSIWTVLAARRRNLIALVRV